MVKKLASVREVGASSSKIFVDEALGRSPWYKRGSALCLHNYRPTVPRLEKCPSIIYSRAFCFLFSFFSFFLRVRRLAPILYSWRSVQWSPPPPNVCIMKPPPPPDVCIVKPSPPWRLNPPLRLYNEAPPPPPYVCIMKPPPHSNCKQVYVLSITVIAAARLHHLIAHDKPDAFSFRFNLLGGCMGFQILQAGFTKIPKLEVVIVALCCLIKHYFSSNFTWLRFTSNKPKYCPNFPFPSFFR